MLASTYEQGFHEGIEWSGQQLDDVLKELACMGLHLAGQDLSGFLFLTSPYTAGPSTPQPRSPRPRAGRSSWRSGSLPTRIQQLIEERQHHADAITAIDQTLAGVGAALGTATGIGGKRKPGRPPASASATATTSPKKRRRRSFATTAEESVLGFIRANKNPTGREIEAHWAQEGRGGPAANTLSKLLKDKKLKREPLKGQRGSRYLLP
jgi:hypothetical protein